MNNLLEIKDLKTHFFTDDGVVKAVDGVDLTVGKGEIFGLVGESGCGKTVTALSILQLLEAPGKIVGGEINFDGVSLLDLSSDEITQMRGSRISMIFQQPQSSLDPVFSIGDQVAEVFQTHKRMGSLEAKKMAVDLLRLVGIPDVEERVNAYPHELSGGQAQRVMIATALALNPELLIADEPTTALDVTIQAQILSLLRDLISHKNTSVVLITHNLGVIAELVSKVAVMYAGNIVEESDVTTLFDNPLHPYTQGLIGSIPVLGEVEDRLQVITGSVPNLIDLPSGCRFAPRCQSRVEYGLDICTELEPELIRVNQNHLVRCWLYQDSKYHKAPLDGLETTHKKRVTFGKQLDLDARSQSLTTREAKQLIRVENMVKYYPVHGGIPRRIVGKIQAVDDVSFTIREGETLGLVGESGCGKTTVGLTMLRLTEPTKGSVFFNDTDVFMLKPNELNSLRKAMQIVFQDPYSSLDPRMPIGESIAEGLKIHKIGTRNDHREMVIDTMRRVGLEDYHYSRYPHEFSGGQRQRVGIARALVLKPKLIVADEPVSALDVSIQSQVLNLLKDLQNEFDLTYLFIAHDLSVVEHISDRVAVMYLGKIIEIADREELFRTPLHPYTQALLSSIPIPNPHIQKQRIILTGEIPSPIDPPSGCSFHPRCPVALEHCAHEEPRFTEVSSDHWVACWRVE